jgi:hypothetical protein
VIWLSAREEDALEQHLVALGQRPARERVAYLALWLVERGLQTGLVAPDSAVATLHVPITQGQIADMLGLSLVHTNRTLQALRKAGQVDWNGTRIAIPQLETVRAMVGFDPRGLPKRPISKGLPVPLGGSDKNVKQRKFFAGSGNGFRRGPFRPCHRRDLPSKRLVIRSRRPPPILGGGLFRMGRPVRGLWACGGLRSEREGAAQATEQAAGAAWRCTRRARASGGAWPARGPVPRCAWNAFGCGGGKHDQRWAGADRHGQFGQAQPSSRSARMHPAPGSPGAAAASRSGLGRGVAGGDFVGAGFGQAVGHGSATMASSSTTRALPSPPPERPDGAPG